MRVFFSVVVAGHVTNEVSVEAEAASGHNPIKEI